MTTPVDPEQGPEAPQLVRPYVITNGRSLLDDHELSLITLVTVAEDSPRSDHLDPEKRRLVELCSGGYLAVAEIAGHSQLPVGIIRILLADLTEAGYLYTRKPIPRAERVERHILEEVLNGLQARFG
ncbi:DUF742 domain-containing protein [Streptomyces sp. NBC_01387]|uniref:DUF742 domain-containing protein n=1 Tax=unclassified Streptomyces TaxID=2593676 RepID=UPI00202408A2|nr:MULTISPECIES: DUF742 domain-containing protein [unclassified Streptomyces]MCX4547523.1 DUF742 domain-containing protein [Streptomyces sp. NBC_01500]WSC19212.1 DUF742 domain-containing protein [Streptomyces sp. NBC_01766]WSV53236.1 DUF742 domain-containing protein [Streptomyces sp. NBC_01014]